MEHIKCTQIGMQNLQECETGVQPQNSVCGVVWFVNECMGNALQLQKREKIPAADRSPKYKRCSGPPWDSINVGTAALNFPGGMLF